MTVEEFERWVDLPENADRLFEYIGGEIAEVPSNPYVSEVAYNIGFAIKLYLRERKMAGHVTGEAGGYMVSGERYAPDVAYLAQEKGPLVAKGYNPIPPDLAVEVMSPSDDPDDLRIKVVNYLRAGTTVWVVNPEKQHIEVYAPDQSPKRVGPEGTLSGGDVLPGFGVAVKDIFGA